MKYQLVKKKYMMFGFNLTLKHFLEKKCGKNLRILPNDDDRSLIISMKFSKNN